MAEMNLISLLPPIFMFINILGDRKMGKNAKYVTIISTALVERTMSSFNATGLAADFAFSEFFIAGFAVAALGGGRGM